MPGDTSEPSSGAVLGLDNIALDLPVAGLGSRALAAAIDYAIVTLLVVFAVAAGVGLAVAFELESPWLVAVLLVTFVFAADWGYFFGFEAATRGRTPGKMAVSLRAVGREGGTASLRGLLVRTLLRHLDLVVGAPLIATDPLARRLGDRLGGTLVVHDRTPVAEVTLGRLPAAWGAREVAVVESFLRRSGELEVDRRERLARRLLRLLERDDPRMRAEVAGYSDPELALRRALRAVEREGS